MSSVVEGGPDQGRRGTWWSAAVQWRNWPLLVKLGMVLVVPVVSALVLGVLRVQADVALADSYTATARIATLRAQFVTVLAAVQHERNEAVRPGGQYQLGLVSEVTDRAVDGMTDVVRRTPELGGAESGYAAVDRALDSLPAVRRQVTDGSAGMVVLSAYNAVVNTVLEYDRALVGQFPDEDLAGTSIALSELLGMREQVALEQAIGNMAMRDGVLPDAGRQLLVEADVRLDDKLDDFRSQAPPALVARYDTIVKNEIVTEFEQMAEALRTTDPAGLPFGQPQWEGASNGTSELMGDLTRQAANALRRDSAELAEDISDRAGLESVLLLTMVLLAAGIGGGVGRYLLKSVGLLRRTALDVAHHGLPEAVESIRSGEGAKVTVEPVPLRTTEEFGQLARAFDAVHGQAVRSAAEEASLRSNLANIFTNLSRRSQGLVERQLRLMEQLEQKTDDPEQLESLFKIDHLATRMRRNNENLMVLSGTGLLRRFSEPMPLPDVLRAAISEVEHYQRAVVRSVPDVRVAGYAAGDLIRSVSELIENATAFSPPDAQVTVASKLLADGSAVIDILDEGVGMGEKELREANEKITGGGGVDVPISRQMGLFVVGRLTARHGIHVRLVPRAEGGLCASVLVPPGLVAIGDPGQTVAIEVPATGAGPNTATEWLSSNAATSWPAAAVMAAGRPEQGPAWPAEPHERTVTSSWLTGAKKADAPATAPARTGLASTWLSAAKKAETGEVVPESPENGRHALPDTPARTTGAAAETVIISETPVTNDLPTRTPGAATSGTSSELPTRTPGAARPSAANAAEPALPARTPGAADDDAVPSLPVRTPGAAARSVGPISGAPRLPHEVFEPVEVAGRLESAGIVVTLPDLPEATTPASILFADNTAGGDGGEAGFSWLEHQDGTAEGSAQQPVEPVVTAGPAGLPKRVPRSQLQGPARGQTRVTPATTRDPAKARGFLSGFQAGIRQSEDRKGETSS